MGLSVVHGIVTGCGGAVTLSSSPGKGTTFEVYFPQWDGGEADTEVEAEGQHVSLTKPSAKKPTVKEPAARGGKKPPGRSAPGKVAGHRTEGAGPVLTETRARN